jgi:hypothetical protein
MKRFIKIISFSTAYLIVCIFSAQAQDTTKNEKPSKAAIIQKQIENKDLTFVAKWVNPVHSTMRQLMEYYDLKITGDSVITYLPYFGRAYTAPLDPTNISVNLSSVIIEYTVTKRKKHEWDIMIKPKDRTDIQSFLLSVFDNGSAYLNVTSTNREPISYNGNLEEKD